MSAAGPPPPAPAVRRITPLDVTRAKGARKLVALTAYTTPAARWLDPHCDVVLVGDSVGMVLHGMETTLGVTLEMMILHGRAVARGCARACVVVDLPFGSYGESPRQAYRSAARLLAETGCAAVKLEGGAEMAPAIAFLAARGVPVMAHLGLMPQAVHAQGGFRAQGRDAAGRERLLADARAVEAAGAFAVVLEGTMEPLAREIAQALRVPVIGIGASPACDGQVLVTDDVLGTFAGFKPRFAKRYAELGLAAEAAVAEYAADVRAGRFPAEEHCFWPKG